MYERPFLDRLDLADVEVDAGRVEPGLGELDGQRQADVSQADDAGACPARLDFLEKGCGEC